MVGGSGPIPLETARNAIPPIAANGKPTIYSIFGAGSTLPPELEPMLRAANIPFSRSPEAAVRAMAHVTHYGMALARAERRCAARPRRPAAGERHAGGISRQGMACRRRDRDAARRTWRVDADEARRIAARIGYPLALKAQAASLTHKSDAGGIVLNVGDDGALAEGWRRLHDNVARAQPSLVLDGVLVERMAPRGVEMVVGARRDPQWGPVLMVGLGGIWIETLNDVRLMPADLDEDGIATEIAKLRGAKLLHGARGGEPADVAALARTTARIGALIRATPAISEIDINPLLVLPNGQGVLALDALIVAFTAVAIVTMPMIALAQEHNLVAELGIVLYLLMGWEFTVGEWIRGVVLIVDHGGAGQA